MPVPVDQVFAKTPFGMARSLVCLISPLSIFWIDEVEVFQNSARVFCKNLPKLKPTFL